MKNRLFVAWAALSMALACTPAQQVAEQRRLPVSPPVHREAETKPALVPQVTPAPVASLPETPVPAPVPQSPAPASPSGQQLAQAAAKAASSAKASESAPVVSEESDQAHALPVTEAPKVQHERIPSWAKEELQATSHKPQAELQAASDKPQAATPSNPQTHQTPQTQEELLVLMEQLISEMEDGDSSAVESGALAGPYPGQVRQVGDVTVEYRVDKPVGDISTSLTGAPATAPLSDTEADEIMRRALERREAAQAGAGEKQLLAAVQPSLPETQAAPAQTAGVGITFMRAGEEEGEEFVWENSAEAPDLPADNRTENRVTENAALQLAIADGRMIDLDESRLMEWENALQARRKGLRPATPLPTWLLKGLEWLSHAPAAEPQRSLTVMPLYRHMEKVGHLDAFDVNKMSDEQVVKALRLLVDEVKSKKKLRSEAQPLPLNPPSGSNTDLKFARKQELAQPSPVNQALSFEGQLSTPGTRSPATEKQGPGAPVPETGSFRSAPAEAPALLLALESQAPAGLLAMTATTPFRSPEALQSVSAIPTEADKRITRRKEYVNKLTRVSVRAAYGFGAYRSTMNYELPNLEATVANAVNSLKSQYPWAPWGQVEVPTVAPQRERTLNKRGQFYLSAGLNVPLGFVEIETGPGRFSQSAYSLQDFWPPWQGLDMTRAGELMMQRVATPEAKTAMTFRIGTELERILPDHLLPRLRWRNMSAGLDASAYYLAGTDLSYRVGVEIIDPGAVDHLKDLFAPVPLIPANTKAQAAEAIVAHVESSLPGYFWLPSLRGYGFGAKAYINFSPRLRFAARYHYERSRGLRLESTDWMPRGPIVQTTFLSFGLETQI